MFYTKEDKVSNSIHFIATARAAKVTPEELAKHVADMESNATYLMQLNMEMLKLQHSKE